MFTAAPLPFIFRITSARIPRSARAPAPHARPLGPPLEALSSCPGSLDCTSVSITEQKEYWPSQRVRAHRTVPPLHRTGYGRYSPSCREGKLSEAHIQPGESLCVKTGAKG